MCYATTPEEHERLREYWADDLLGEMGEPGIERCDKLKRNETWFERQKREKSFFNKRNKR